MVHPAPDERAAPVTGLRKGDAEPSGAWTPGPWVAKVSAFSDRIEAAAHGGSCIAETGNWLLHEKREQHANARLIAAAPALYEALRGLMQTVDAQYRSGLKWDPETVESARAALRLAQTEAR